MKVSVRFASFLKDLAAMRGEFGVDALSEYIRHNHYRDGDACPIEAVAIRKLGARRPNAFDDKLRARLGLDDSMARLIIHASDGYVSRGARTLRRLMLRAVGLGRVRS